jgi:hypothetical protein
MEKVVEESLTLLVDIHSPTFKSIARQLAPLESSHYLHVTSANLVMSVSLPRMKLSFFVNEDMQLQSRNLCDQVVDENQSTGTMFGLHNQLVLRAKHRVAQSLPQSRTVLIPYGAVHFENRDNHVRVTIAPGLKRHVIFYQYKVDSDLQYLAGSTSLNSRLFKIYLHAVTSHCLPDPLTGRTGTEEALHELSESATTSFEQIDEEQARLLQLIGALTPKRQYYPDHLRSMQMTHWTNLPPLAQHYAFCHATNSILDRASTLELFNSAGFDLKPYATEFNGKLLERAARRTCLYYPAGTAARLPKIMVDPSKDGPYHKGRDYLSSGWTEEGGAASWASGLAHRRWRQPTYIALSLVSLAETWDTVQGPSESLELGYSSDWLNLHLPSFWISLYNLFRQSAMEGTQFKLCSSLATATYGGWLPQNLVAALIAFATNPTFQHLPPPSHPSYRLSDGYKPTKARIRQYVSAAVHDITYTPSIGIPRNGGEDSSDWIQRRSSDYATNTFKLTSQLAQAWVDCWPGTPSAPTSVYAPWFKIGDCLENVELYFKSCSRNVELRAHLQAVERALTRHPTSTGLAFNQRSSALPNTQHYASPTTQNLDALCIEQLMERRGAPAPGDILPQPNISVSGERGSPPDTFHLSKLFAEFHTNTAHPLHCRYATDLEASRADLAKVNAVILPNQLPAYEELYENCVRRRDYLGTTHGKIQTALGPSSAIESIASTAGIWPRLTSRAILGRLALWARATTPSTWHSTLLGYAQTFMEYQRSQRLIGLAREERQEEFYKELDFPGVGSRTDIDCADWLLVQVSMVYDGLRG